jgi:hypothetical protein
MSVKPARQRSILIVDDEAGSPIMSAVVRRLQEEGWRAAFVEPEGTLRTGDDYEDATLSAIVEKRPDAVLLDVWFGDHEDSAGSVYSVIAWMAVVRTDPKTVAFIAPTNADWYDYPDIQSRIRVSS